jgi:thymidylate kinase
MGVGPDARDHGLPTTRLARAVKRAPVPRGARSVLRLLHRIADEWYRQLLAAHQVRRGRVVVFDRHFLADFHAADVAAPNRTPARRAHGFLLTHAYPRPDLVIFLDAPPEVLFARKGEGTIASLTRRRAEYRQLGASLERFAVIEATQPLEAVVAQVAGLIREHGSRR